MAEMGAMKEKSMLAATTQKHPEVHTQTTAMSSKSIFASLRMICFIRTFPESSTLPPTSHHHRFIQFLRFRLLHRLSTADGRRRACLRVA